MQKKNSRAVRNLKILFLTKSGMKKRLNFFYAGKICLFGIIASNRTIIPEICCFNIFWCGKQCVLRLVLVIVQVIVVV